MDMSRVSSRASALLGLGRTNAEVYPLLDWNLAIRIGGLLWLVGVVTASALLPFASPTHLLGQAGWAVMAAILFGAFSLGIFLLARPETVRPLPLLMMGYAAAAGLGVGQALIGSEAQFELLFLLLAAYVASVHPARRVLPLLGCVAIVQAVSTLSGGSAAVDVVQTVSAGALLVLMTLMSMVHAQSNRSLTAQLMGLREHAERRALTDSLTGLANRRAFDEALVRHVASNGRYNRPLSLAMLDVHHFKSINDRFGHEAGDAALVAVANALTNEVRLPDTCFRWGGDEFAVLLPEIRPDGAEAAAQRIVEAVSRNARLPDDLPLWIDFGVANLRAGERVEDLLERADATLLATKRAIVA
jgi:diguanylate cyclase (GGDEF)-like protein